MSTEKAYCQNRTFHSPIVGGVLSAVALGIIALLAALPVAAQVQTGISGTVADPTGAVIPHAQLTVTNNSTGVASSTSTSSAGTFTLLGLLPGTYSIATTAPGFKKVVTAVVVDVAKISTVNVTLPLGTAAQTIEVQGSSVALETAAPNIGTTLSPELVESAPLEISGMTRQIDSFITLTPGVQVTSLV